MNKINKILVSVATIVSFSFYAYFARAQDTQLTAVAPVRQQVRMQATPAQTLDSAPQRSTQQQPTAEQPAQLPRQNGQYRDGTYTGTSVDVFYGLVQVEAIIKGGKIADVRFLQYPNDRPNSIRLNSRAMPALAQEAIQAQSANVDGVSGASETSQGFVRSLSAALAQARA